MPTLDVPIYSCPACSNPIWPGQEFEHVHPDAMRLYVPYPELGDSAHRTCIDHLHEQVVDALETRQPPDTP